ncbi:MAG: hypothetical protein HKN91_17705 [Acidimicrobiia bacterium]|nr:hypothetical protein [Acidimicrobiia bacterium]
MGDPSQAVELARRIRATNDEGFAKPISEWPNFQDVTVDDTLVERCIRAVRKEESPFQLGVVLGLDTDLSMPVSLIKAVYERLLDLGADDALTRYRYAQYLLLHGPDWDDDAQVILGEVSEVIEAGGFAKAALGHHPVFYAEAPRPISGS